MKTLKNARMFSEEMAKFGNQEYTVYSPLRRARFTREATAGDYAYSTKDLKVFGEVSALDDGEVASANTRFTPDQLVAFIEGS